MRWFLPEMGLKSFSLVLGLLLSVGSGRAALLPTVPKGDRPPSPFPPEYQAEIMVSAGVQNTTQKTFFKGQKIRIEMEKPKMNGAILVDRETRKSFVLNPSLKKAIELPFPDRPEIDALWQDPATKIEKLGFEPVKTVVCRKYKIKTADEKILYLWVNKNNLPVRLSALPKPMDSDFMQQWKTFAVGPQDEALFKIPSDYQIQFLPAESPSSPPSNP